MEEIMIDDWVEDLPLEDHLIVFQRALQALGYEYELKPGGGVAITEVYADHEALEEAMQEEYKRMHAAELLTQMTQDGDIRITGINADGEFTYAATT